MFLTELILNVTPSISRDHCRKSHVNNVFVSSTKLLLKTLLIILGYLRFVQQVFLRLKTRIRFSPKKYYAPFDHIRTIITAVSFWNLVQVHWCSKTVLNFNDQVQWSYLTFQVEFSPHYIFTVSGLSDFNISFVCMSSL